MGNHKRTIHCLLDSEDLKHELQQYAKYRGLKTTSILANHALIEYIRRHKPKNPTALLHAYIETDYTVVADCNNTGR